MNSNVTTDVIIVMGIRMQNHKCKVHTILSKFGQLCGFVISSVYFYHATANRTVFLSKSVSLSV